jgi:hypothetical protein
MEFFNCAIDLEHVERTYSNILPNKCGPHTSQPYNKIEETIEENNFNIIFSVLVLCTQVNMMFVMLLWVYILTGRAWKIILLDYIGIEGTRFCSEISLTRTVLTA